MSAKAFLALIVLPALVCGCASLKRFAPPGIVKYEELAGDQPMNAEIKARAQERKESDEQRFPNLSEAPSAAPEGMSATQQASQMDALRDQRADLSAALAEDLTLAAAERAEPVPLPGKGDAALSLSEARDALAKAVEEDDAVAREERGLAPRPRDDGAQ
jgi:hypothetical protein